MQIAGGTAELNARASNRYANLVACAMHTLWCCECAKSWLRRRFLRIKKDDWRQIDDIIE